MVAVDNLALASVADTAMAGAAHDTPSLVSVASNFFRDATHRSPTLRAGRSCFSNK